jgi:excinuclease ABC subunit C
LEYIEVGSEIESLLLESRLIKKFRPFFNISAKDDKSPYYIHLTRENLPRPEINHTPGNSLAGPFLTRFLPQKILRQLRHITPYCTAPRPVKKPCIYSHLGLCLPCPGESGFDFGLYQKNISRLRQLLKGNFKGVRREMQKQMMVYSHKENFEAASKMRDQIKSLDYLLSVPVRPDEYLENPNLVSDQRQSALNSILQILSSTLHHLPSKLNRIEMYDIAHLSGDSASGAMVVAQSGQIRPDLYRHFNIKLSSGTSDVDSLREVLTRRLNRTDWPVPDLIVLDGGKPQLSIVPSLNLRGGIEGGELRVVALAKQHETIIIPTDSDFIEINPDRSDPGLRLLQSLRDEAHRFSRRLHHTRRRKSLLKK